MSSLPAGIHGLNKYNSDNRDIFFHFKAKVSAAFTYVHKSKVVLGCLCEAKLGTVGSLEVHSLYENPALLCWTKFLPGMM